jgi:hypothetical protein
MGWGDSLMACGEAKELHEKTGKKVMIGNGKVLEHPSEIFANNPFISNEITDDAVWLNNCTGNRPYIRETKGGRIYFNKYRPKPAQLFFTDDEIKWAKQNVPNDFIVIEPNVKETYKHTVNKAWHYWTDLIKHDYNFVQLGIHNDPITKQIKTKTFREALLILSQAKMFVGTDGGLHHAAAALNIPAVVIWTGFTSPKHLGYDSHINIHDGGEPCGTYSGICPHCVKIAKSITVERVLDAVNTIRCRT